MKISLVWHRISSWAIKNFGPITNLSQIFLGVNYIMMLLAMWRKTKVFSRMHAKKMNPINMSCTQQSIYMDVIFKNVWIMLDEERYIGTDILINSETIIFSKCLFIIKYFSLKKNDVIRGSGLNSFFFWNTIAYD